MLGIFTDDHDFSLAFDNLAFFAHLFYRRPDLHLNHSFHATYKPAGGLFVSFGAPGDAPLGQVIRRHFHRHLVARQYPDKVHSQFTGYVG